MTPRRGLLLVLPALVPTVLVVGAAVVTMVLQSLGLVPLVGEPRLSLDAYRANGADLLDSVRLSLLIAVAATTIAAAVGLLTALLIAGSGWGQRLLSGSALATLPVPHLVGAAAMGLLLADSGLVARLLGRTDGGFPELVAGPWWIAVVAEYAWKEAAFVALVVGATLATRVADLDEAAAGLGATRARRLRHVTLPLLLPALVVSSALGFVYALGSLEVPALLGASSPEPLSVMTYRLLTSVELTARPEAAAVATVTTLLSLAALGLAVLALRRSPAWR